MKTCPNCSIDLVQVSDTRRECPQCRYSFTNTPVPEKRNEIIERVNDEYCQTIVEARLSEDGLAPWQKQYVIIPKSNYDTKKEYRGVNRWLLSYSAETQFLTEQSVQKHGALLKEDAAPRYVITFRPPMLKKHEKLLSKDEQEEILRKRPFFRGSHLLYRAKDVEGLPEKEAVSFNKAYASIEEFLSEFPVKIDEGGNDVKYISHSDTIIIPGKSQYVNPEEYYRDLFRELAHWTGHKDRLNRKPAVKEIEVAREELMAEMVSGFLCVYFDIPINKNAVSYFDHWLQKIKEDAILLSTAGQRAEKVLDYFEIN